MPSINVSFTIETWWFVAYFAVGVAVMFAVLFSAWWLGVCMLRASDDPWTWPKILRETPAYLWESKDLDWIWAWAIVAPLAAFRKLVRSYRLFRMNRATARNRQRRETIATPPT